MRVLYKLHDLGEGGFLAHARRAERDAAGRVQRAADHFVARFLGHRHRFPGQHRFVHRRRALGDDSVHRHLLAGLHDHHIAEHHYLDRDIDLLPIAEHVRRFRAQRCQPANRFGCAALRSRFQQPPEQDERDDGSDCLVVDIGGQTRTQEERGCGRRDK